MGNPEHECRQGHRCKSRTRDADARWHGAGVERQNTLCRSCENHAFAAIGELANDYWELIPARLEERRRAGAPKVSGSSELPIPIQLPIDTLMTDIDNETLRWTLRITKGDPLPARAEDRVARCVAILGANLGTLVDLPRQVVSAWFPYADGGDYGGRDEFDGVDAVLRLARLHDRAISALGLEETRFEWLREPCHVCGHQTVTASLEEPLVKCRNCHNVWDQDEFARLNNPLAVAA
ncbi:hypothetical protein ACIBQ0_17110 [Nocardia nova]|uniref:hypothetical protein n=1 Tax=Nocardia nova TaxID=37330 RepID=UPI0037A53B39